MMGNSMTDEGIVNLYWARLESAIRETAEKYGKMLQSLSESIVHSREDAEECVSDSYVAAWNSMPTNRPTYLGGYMAKLCRNISINLAEKKKASKRQGEITVFDELSECLPDSENTDTWFENQQLKRIINGFLTSLPTEKRVIFMRRYFFNDDIKDIAVLVKMREGNVRAILCRLREQLKKMLEAEL